MGNERIRLQQWFDNGGTVEGLKAEYGIDARVGVEFPNLVSLKYCQIDSDRVRAHPLVVQCRGIVLDIADNYRVVCRSFDRFFNEGMTEAAPIDWSTARVMEKADGSLCQAYWYAGQWRVATSGSPEASGDVNGFGLSFADYFWRTLDAKGYELPAEDIGCTLIFELVGPYNRVVVQYPESDLILLGARDLRTMVELAPRDAQSLYMPTARVIREFSLRSFAEIASELEKVNPLEQEGFVVCDAQFNRQKVKSARYVQLHRAKDGCNPRSLMEIARQGETSEVELAFPELKATLDGYRERIDAWSAEVDAEYARLKDVPVQKDFAILATKTKCPAALFSIRAKKVASARGYLGLVHIDRCMEALAVSAVATSPNDRTA